MGFGHPITSLLASYMAFLRLAPLDTFSFPQQISKFLASPVS